MLSFNKPLLLALIGCSAAYAHVVSISNGELRVIGRTGSYELRMPSYEVESLAHPETTLLDEIHFGGAERISSKCKTNDGWLVCHAQYEFKEDVADKVAVECTLYRVTVPNHVHILYAVQGENSDQKIFDQNTSSVEMRFHPPSLWESIWRDSSAGATRLLKSVGGLLFLVALALMARSWKEVLWLGLLFMVTEWVARPIFQFIPIAMTPEFLEAVLTLSAAYLATELLFVPESRSRWIIVPLFGLIHGLRFAGFPALSLTGVNMLQAIALIAITFASLRLPPSWRRLTCIAIVALAAARFLVLIV